MMTSDVPARVLVFGRTGQVARALASIAGPSWVFAGRDRADLTKPDDMVACLNNEPWDVVINAAAYTAVDLAESQPELAYAVNADAPGVMARHCASRNVPFIHLSTDYVFDGKKTGSYVESDPVNPLGFYVASKAKGEVPVLNAGGRPVILRTSWVYALQGRNFVLTMLRLGQERENISVVGDQTGAPTSANDIAVAINHLVPLVRERTMEPGLFHMTSAGETTWFGLAHEIFRIADLNGIRTPNLNSITTAQYPTAAQRPANSQLDCTKLKGAYGVSLPHWQVGLQSCLDSCFSYMKDKKAG